MLIPKPTLTAIAQGRASLAFRRWKRPTVKAGGTLRTAIGVLDIEAVEPIAEDDITDEDAKRAGHPDKAALLEQLDKRQGQLYRIAFALAGEDPRIALRADDRLSDGDRDAIASRLARLDAHSTHGPWT